MTCVPVLWHAEDEKAKAKVFPECPFLQPFPSNLLTGRQCEINLHQPTRVGGV